jgi:hypothetical protein
MKTTKSMLVYFITFISMYFILSIFVCLFYSQTIDQSRYVNCITDRSWLILYTLFLGWWISMIPTYEYHEYLENNENLED